MLEVAVDGAVLTLNFESPLHNLLGFEHAARTPKERAAAAALKARLEKPDELFVPTSAAMCRVASVRLDSPVFNSVPAEAGGHADLDAEFAFRCERPELLRSLEARLFDAFPNLQRLNVQVAPAGGAQVGARLTRSERTVSW